LPYVGRVQTRVTVNVALTSAREVWTIVL